ncbi:MAG: LPS assembly protein LptD [Sphingobium sp.]
MARAEHAAGRTSLLLLACACGAIALSPVIAVAQTTDSAFSPQNDGPASILAAPTSIAPPDVPLPGSDEQVGFSADQLSHNNETDVVTASGNVQMLRQGNLLRADTIVWDRKSGTVEAIGNVSVTDPQGNVAYGDKLDVTDTLKDGVVENLLLVMDKGGRLAAMKGQKVNGVYMLDHAAYSPCALNPDADCPQQPSWQIKAVKVLYNPERQRVFYRDAQFELFGVPLFTLPAFSHPVGQTGGTGFLVPDFRINGNNGAEISAPYFIKLAPNRDLTLTPHFYSAALPMLEGNFRALTDLGAYRITGFATYGSRTAISAGSRSQRNFRGSIDASGKIQLDPNWNISGALRRASDRTFLRRYTISADDRLRSTIQAERIGQDSYFSLSGWVFQTMRANDPSGQMPIALPVLDYRRRFTDPVLGGRVELQANSLAITRTSGQDTQRAFTSAEWNLRRLTGLGQEITFTGFVRGDVYHSSNNLLSPTITYRGNAGWQTRGIAAVAADMRWPFMGSFLGGTQRITPRVQIVAAPHLANLSLPNEDARSIELEDSNLFALNRFPGYDRFEDSSRITYGVEYALTLPGFTLDSIVGQSYRLNNRVSIFPEGTGLSARASDIVGRTTIRYRDFLSLTHRFRIDKNSLAVRRNEIDAMIGTRATYLTIGYLKLNRDITTSVEDLADREEIRLGARVKLARYWSVFGSTIIDLTGKSEDSAVLTNGFEPVRHRLGLDYQND